MTYRFTLTYTYSVPTNHVSIIQIETQSEAYALGDYYPHYNCDPNWRITKIEIKGFHY